MATDATRQAIAKYHASHIKRVPLNLNDRTDQDIIDHLATLDNVQGYIKSLIRESMERKKEG